MSSCATDSTSEEQDTRYIRSIGAFLAKRNVDTARHEAPAGSRPALSVVKSCHLHPVVEAARQREQRELLAVKVVHGARILYRQHARSTRDARRRQLKAARKATRRKLIVVGSAGQLG